jgi:hypothetical protein
MRKMLMVLAIVAMPALGGCAAIAEGALNLPTGVLTQDYRNPITRDHLFRLENGLIVGVTALQQYKNLCEAGTLANNCIGTVQAMQGYVKQARPLLRQLRTFVRKNDQVNARVIFTQIRSLLGEVRNIAAANGINVPAMGVE